ncbi:MAG: MaoC family dehydratase N-terminal domain-containing protein [Haloarculaceae archaeon]
MPTIPFEELEAKVGESAVTVEDFHIEAGKVEEFARAIKDDNPAFRDEAAADEQGFDAVPAPLTFTRVSTFPRYRAIEGRGIEIGFQQEYAIHGEQSYEYERPLEVGDVLTGTTTLVDVYERDGGRGGTMTFAILETEYHDQDGDLVLTEQSTVIETGGAIDPDGGDDD